MSIVSLSLSLSTMYFVPTPLNIVTWFVGTGLQIYPNVIEEGRRFVCAYVCVHWHACVCVCAASIHNNIDDILSLIMASWVTASWERWKRPMASVLYTKTCCCSNTH